MIKAKLEENNPDRVKPFMAGAQEEIKKIMGNMKNYQVTNYIYYCLIAQSVTHVLPELAGYS